MARTSCSPTPATTSTCGAQRRPPARCCPPTAARLLAHCRTPTAARALAAAPHRRPPIAALLVDLRS